MTRILFVDDEPNVLMGLARMLRGKRRQWDMTFVEGGPAALKLLQSQRFDIIVADLRMPVVDGVELLSKVRDAFPHTIRIILSGDTSLPAVFRSAKLAHQTLIKPCEAPRLIEVLERASLLSGFLRQEGLAALVSRIESLPTLNRNYELVMDELEAEEPSLHSIGQIVGRDVSMAATVLKVINSAYFGLGRHVTSPVDAVLMLGLEVVRGLVVSTKIFSAFDQTRISGFSFEELWRHSFATAGLAKAIATAEGMDKLLAERAFTAGLLHDLGKLVLAYLIPALYSEVLSRRRWETMPFWEAERQALGVSHAEVGAFLMGLWGFSEDIIDALAYHHQPASSPQGGFGPMLAVHVANYCEHRLQPDQDQNGDLLLDRPFLAQAGLEHKLEAWIGLSERVARGEVEHE